MREETASILIVEGENLTAQDLAQPLLTLGYRIAGVVDSGPRAVQAAEQIRPDLALMDARLTGSMDSFTAAGEIRNRLRIPIVFLVSRAEADAVHGHARTSSYGYVAKPFLSTELDATILQALNRHRLVQELFTGQAWLATLLHSLHDAVIATDSKGRISFLNAPEQTLTGWSFADAVGLPVEQIYSLQTLEREGVQEYRIRTVLQRKKATSRRRFLLTSQTGVTVPIEASASPIVGQGQLLGAVAVLRDVSEVLTRENHPTEARLHAAVDALDHTRSDLRELSKYLIDSHETERRSLAKTFHDDFSQRTALLGFQLDALSENLQDDSESLARLQAIRSQLDSLSEGLRRTSHNLYPSVLSDLGLMPALRGLVLDFQANGWRVSLLSKGALPAEPAADKAIALFRIAEEAIRNITRCSSTTSAQIQLLVSVDEGNVRMVIEGAGNWFETARGSAEASLWLLNIQERARIAGGNLLLSTAKEQGTQVLVRVPLG